MYKLKLNAKDCISCGICMDVCSLNAIDMRINKGKTIEGNNFIYLDLNGKTNKELPPEKMFTFPFMALPELCDGCMVCVKECPTYAIDIENEFNSKELSLQCMLNKATFKVENS